MDRIVLKKTKPAVSSSESKENEYRRSQSMVSKSRKQRPTKFRRSELAIDSRELVISVIEPPRKSMDGMSSEEFQLSIESFIAERKKVLVQENSAHYKRIQVKSMRTVLGFWVSKGNESFFLGFWLHHPAFLQIRRAESRHVFSAIM
ncbi:hypothetical protein V6N13_020369 [Hibiscus sabdariffa]|uniref:Uncharacterized protein n=1 Tax=Hibiscus sabdariffa TaxID=183260 RepID=A0ABR2ET87_9ROSI